MKIKDTKFLKGASSLKDFPDTEYPEIAFIGRSNAGKSSLINTLTGRKKLAYISSKPGKTEEINFFQVTFDTDSIVTFVDLPGFGYSKFSFKKREKLNKLIVDYIRNRKQLTVICLLNDSKRVPKEDELAIKKLAFEENKNLVIILTKTDRLNQKEINLNRREIAKSYGIDKDKLILSGFKTPKEETLRGILDFL